VIWPQNRTPLTLSTCRARMWLQIWLQTGAHIS